MSHHDPELFDPRRLYRPQDPELRQLAAEGTMRIWRCKGRGPRYLKVGGKVLYRGSALNRWIEDCEDRTVR